MHNTSGPHCILQEVLKHLNVTLKLATHFFFKKLFIPNKSFDKVRGFEVLREEYSEALKVSLYVHINQYSTHTFPCVE